ncbi:uncharacterized protein HaLaN_13257 [Haematococcus lacustris]|uniref:C3H1-type domain-containing protein n=1 Tax=Haematococcus lacustris TaxID=44745 RepID=A0A699ZC42_HAELA|nr:uncharacterized protein HaLaN_13257 [Haematococcus lacustris]
MTDHQLNGLGGPGAAKQVSVPLLASQHQPRIAAGRILMSDILPCLQTCTFFVRTGTCAYGDRCKFLHPADCPPPQLNSAGYPLRNTDPICAHYLKKGWCAFGITCKFHCLFCPDINMSLVCMSATRLYISRSCNPCQCCTVHAAS